jgi:hypothetical protein
MGDLLHLVRFHFHLITMRLSCPTKWKLPCSFLYLLGIMIVFVAVIWKNKFKKLQIIAFFCFNKVIERELSVDKFGINIHPKLPITRGDHMNPLFSVCTTIYCEGCSTYRSTAIGVLVAITTTYYKRKLKSYNLQRYHIKFICKTIRSQF